MLTWRLTLGALLLTWLMWAWGFTFFGDFSNVSPHSLTVPGLIIGWIGSLVGFVFCCVYFLPRWWRKFQIKCPVIHWKEDWEK